MTAARCGVTLSAAAFAFASYRFVLLLLALRLMLWSEEKPLTGLVTRWGVSFSGRAARSPCKRWTSSPAVAGRDGRGRGPAEGGRPTLPESVRGLRCGPAADEMPLTSRPAPTPCGACVVAPLRGRSGWDATAGLACAFVARCLPLPLPGGPGYAYNDRLCAP